MAFNRANITIRIAQTAFAILLAGSSLLAVCGALTEAESAEIRQFTRPGFASVNSWLLELEDGVVVIDAQRVTSAGAEVAAAIEATGKPLLGVIITHPHPDHFGGLAAITNAFPDAPVYASAATTKVIRTDSNGFQAATRQAIPDDVPDIFAAPNRTFDHGETLTFGSLELRIDEIGAGESETMTMVFAPAENALFVGDLVAHQMTGFLLEGRSGAWLQQINQVIADYGSAKPTIYPGHGKKGSFDTLLTNQKAWLKDMRRLVFERLDDDGLSDADLAEIGAEMQRLYPNYPMVAAIPPLLTLNIQAVAKELLQKRPPSQK
jgi:glyoxylase-like metal-dependent hydrolase (beta-lactamase superfamily II)